MLVEIDQVVNDVFHQMRRGNTVGHTGGTRSEMADATMGVQLMGNNQMAQQFLVPNNLQSSNDMYGPQPPNQPQFQGFSNFMQLN